MARRRDQVPAHFIANASIVFRLGEELITDIVQALVELVKNSYDSDATWVKVTIDTRANNKRGRKYQDAKGVITIEDDGDGMRRETIEQGWLTIGNSPKRVSKERGEVTRLGRTPIGDKGLGRLGVQRLASNVEILTKSRDELAEFYVAFSWHDFRDAESLGEVPVTIEERARGKSEKPGTTLILSDLQSTDTWQQELSIQDLQRKLSGMISPFQEARDFVVYVEIDGKHLELAEITKRIRETALLKYQFHFDGSIFHVSGKARLEYLQPSDKQDQVLLRSLCRQDGGKTLFEYLSRKAGKRRPPLFTQSKSAGWFSEFGIERRLEDIDKIKMVNGFPANPGPFRGEIDAVSLDRSNIQNHAFDRFSDYRRLVADLSGVRVYRDGFGIRVGGDWLGLGKQWTTATSYYGLRPSNVLGFVALTAKDNAALIETTSREGFQVTPHYENFFSLLTEFVRFAGDVQEFLRRGVLEFLKEHSDRKAQVSAGDSATDITGRIEDVANRLFTEKMKLDRYAGSFRPVADKASSTLAVVRKELSTAVKKDHKVVAAVERLEQTMLEVSVAADDVEKVLAEIGEVLGKASELKDLREVLDRRWKTLQDEVSSLYESVSLGLTAEALSHEIHNIADGLAQRSSALLRKVRANGVQKSTIVAFVEHVRTSVSAMRKQLSHLTPSLRYLREQRERIEMAEFVNELADFYSTSRKEKKVRIAASTKKGRSFSVQMNKGKLTQVFDNLILNAEYWLQEAVRAEKIELGEISIFVDHPVVRVLDNGRGVDPAVEESLFDPFITTKRRGEGRGLGLFIVQQLLDSESCSVILTPEKNSHKRRYVFEIDFSGAISG